jgi:hypothetical protein
VVVVRRGRHRVVAAERVQRIRHHCRRRDDHDELDGGVAAGEPRKRRRARSR